MSDPSRDNADALWHNLVASFEAAVRDRRSLKNDPALSALMAAEVDRPALVRRALGACRDLQPAAHLITRLDVGDLKALFPVLVEWSSTGHGVVQVFRDAIARIDRAWVLDRIEAAAEPFLREGTYDEYRRFLELYENLDPECMRRLALRAAAHPDPDVSEAGVDFLVKIHGRPMREQVGALPPDARDRFFNELREFVGEPQPVAN